MTRDRRERETAPTRAGAAVGSRTLTVTKVTLVLRMLSFQITSVRVIKVCLRPGHTFDARLPGGDAEKRRRSPGKNW